MLAFLVNYPEPHHLAIDAGRQQGPDLTQPAKTKGKPVSFFTAE